MLEGDEKLKSEQVAPLYKFIAKRQIYAHAKSLILQKFGYRYSDLIYRMNFKTAYMPTSTGPRTAPSCKISHQWPILTWVVMDLP